MAVKGASLSGQATNFSGNETLPGTCKASLRSETQDVIRVALRRTLEMSSNMANFNRPEIILNWHIKRETDIRPQVGKTVGLNYFSRLMISTNVFLFGSENKLEGE